MRSLVASTLGVCIALAPITAHAECLWDSDCGRGQRCVGGACVSPDGEPVGGGQAPAPPAPVFDDAGGGGGGGWGVAGGIVGFGLALTSLGLALGAELTRTEQIPSLPLGATATVLVIAGTPIVAVASNSARRHGARGVPALRIIGWITFPLTIIGAGTLIGLGVAEETPPGGVITAVGLLGAATLALHGVDALVAGIQGASLVADGPVVAPYVTAITADGGTGGVLGLSGTF